MIGDQQGEPRRFQRGSALILVLWISLLLSMVLLGIITVSRTELRLARAGKIEFLAEQAALSALEQAAFEIATAPDLVENFRGRTYQINGFTVQVGYSDEARKLDLNLANQEELTRFFTYLGPEPELAQKLAARVADWRDTDNLARPNGAEQRDYVRARDQRKPRNRHFRSISELNEVLGITKDIMSCAKAGITVFGAPNGPDAAFLSKLYQKQYPKEQFTQTITSLGTAARVSNAGGRYSLIATVTSSISGENPIISILGVFRISGNITDPYQWIVVAQSTVELEQKGCSQTENNAAL